MRLVHLTPATHLLAAGWEEMDPFTKVQNLYMGKRGFLYWATQSVGATSQLGSRQGCGTYGAALLTPLACAAPAAEHMPV